MTTVGAALLRASSRLGAAGVPTPRLDARILLAHALALAPEAVLGARARAVADDRARAFEHALARRLRGEPVSRILGRREFWSLDFALSPDALDPRADSECVVAAALEAIADRTAALRALDLGTGTGCLLLALLAELPRATGLGVDVSAPAAALARANAVGLGLDGRAAFAVGDWGAAIAARFDVVLCNPPYLAEAEIETLPTEVRRHDPRLALAGGADGLEAYRRVLGDLGRLVAPGGLAAVEIGMGQAPAVAAIAAENGLAVEKSHCDLSGIERCLVLRTGHDHAPPGAGRRKVWRRGRDFGKRLCALTR